MSVIAWGKPFIEIQVVGDSDPNNWRLVDNPKEGTFKLTSQDGEKTEAKGEGGEVVDVRYSASSTEITFQQFLKKKEDGSMLPDLISDEDISDSGMAVSEYAIRFCGEDPSVGGLIAPRCSVTKSMEYSATDGILYTYKFNVLKPTTGKRIQKWSGTEAKSQKDKVISANKKPNELE